MGFSGLSMGSLLLIGALALLLFGSKRMRSAGEDIGSAIRGFRRAMQDGTQDAENATQSDRTIECVDKNDSKSQ